MNTFKKYRLEFFVVILHGVFLVLHTCHEFKIGEFDLTGITSTEGLLESGATVFGTLTILLFFIRFIKEKKKNAC